MLTYIFTVVLSLFLALSSAESQISLSAEPDVISERLTDTLTLTCSLQDVSASEDPEASSHSSTNYDIEHVSSIIILRKGSANPETPVAKIIGSNSAEAVTDEGNLQVTGDLNPDKPSSSQFLKLVWTKPGRKQAGQYNCEVHALDMLGRFVVLKTNAEVKSEVPNIQELITQMIKLEEKTNVQEQTINELKEKSNTQEQTVKEMKSVLKPPHAEQGVVQCIYAPGGWRPTVGGPNYRSTFTSVQFKQPYVDIPVISAGVVYLDVDKNYNTRYVVDVTDVSKTGFKIKCSTYSNTVLYVLRVRWTSTVA